MSLSSIVTVSMTQIFTRQNEYCCVFDFFRSRVGLEPSKSTPQRMLDESQSTTFPSATFVRRKVCEANCIDINIMRNRYFYPLEWTRRNKQLFKKNASQCRHRLQTLQLFSICTSTAYGFHAKNLEKISSNSTDWHNRAQCDDNAVIMAFMDTTMSTT